MASCQHSLYAMGRSVLKKIALKGHLCDTCYSVQRLASMYFALNLKRKSLGKKGKKHRGIKVLLKEKKSTFQ